MKASSTVWIAAAGAHASPLTGGLVVRWGRAPSIVISSVGTRVVRLLGSVPSRARQASASLPSVGVSAHAAPAAVLWCTLGFVPLVAVPVPVLTCAPGLMSFAVSRCLAAASVRNFSCAGNPLHRARHRSRFVAIAIRPAGTSVSGPLPTSSSPCLALNTSRAPIHIATPAASPSALVSDALDLPAFGRAQDALHRGPAPPAGAPFPSSLNAALVHATSSCPRSAAGIVVMHAFHFQGTAAEITMTAVTSLLHPVVVVAHLRTFARPSVQHAPRTLY